MQITAAMVKELRERTGSGMMECKKALQEADGDLELAIENMRKSGLAKADKKAGRTAAEGLVVIALSDDNKEAAIVEVNCETDFVSRNESFREFAHEMALQIAAANPKWVSEDQIPEEILKQEIEDARAFAKSEGKPEKVIDKIVEGRLEKFKNDHVLLRQTYIRDDDMIVQDLLNEKIAFIGENIVVRRFERWELGKMSHTEEEEES